MTFVADTERRTGKTWKQIDSMKHYGLFVHCTNDIHYITTMLGKIDSGSKFSVSKQIWTRSDGRIVNIERRNSIEDPNIFLGRHLSELVLDHAFVPTTKELFYLEKIRERVRPEYIPNVSS